MAAKRSRNHNPDPDPDLSCRREAAESAAAATAASYAVFHDSGEDYGDVQSLVSRGGSAGTSMRYANNGRQELGRRGKNSFSFEKIRTCEPRNFVRGAIAVKLACFRQYVEKDL